MEALWTVVPPELTDQSGKQNHDNFASEFHGFLLVSNMTIQKSRSLPLKGSL